MTLIEKVVPVIFRNINQRTEILVFKHPIAGIQIVKGTVETNEELEEAALRELYFFPRAFGQGMVMASLDILTAFEF